MPSSSQLPNSGDAPRPEPLVTRRLWEPPALRRLSIVDTTLSSGLFGQEDPESS